MYGGTDACGTLSARTGASESRRTLWFVVSAVFHYLGPAFAVLLFARVDVLGVAWLRIASAALVLRRLAPAVAGGRARSSAPAAGSSSSWGAVLAAMNACFYLAIDRLPLATVAAIEFLPVIALAALGARTQRNVAGAVAGGPGRVPAHRRPAGGRAARHRARLRERRAVRRATSCWPTGWRGTRRSSGHRRPGGVDAGRGGRVTPSAAGRSLPGVARPGGAARRHRRRASAPR